MKRALPIIITKLAIVVLVTLSACTMEPHYERPAAPVPAAWTGRLEVENAGSVTDIGWRQFFPDRNVQRLIELSLANNRDLRVAALNVQAAQAQYRIQRADLFPTVAVSGIEQVQKSPAGAAAPGAQGASTPTNGGTGSVPSNGQITRSYGVGIGFTSYEIDLFGKIRSLNHAALEQYFGFAETRRSAQLSLIAEVASAYLAVVADETILNVTRQTLVSQTASYDLNKRNLDAGTTTALALRQSETAVDTSKVNLALYTRQAAQDRNALAVLVGAPLPDDIEFNTDLGTEVFSADLPVAMPSEVLAQRPDVLVAEHQLIAANADIGAARAAFFPSISLTGSYGTASSQLSGLFKGGSSTWAFSPQINLPIFAGGANAANLELAKIEKNIFVAQYEKAIQSAFREVDDALAARQTLDEQLTAERALLAAAAESYQLSDLRFRNGVDSFLPVLDAQRTLYAAQQGVVNLELSRLQNMATLYKALGGGTKAYTAMR